MIVDENGNEVVLGTDNGYFVSNRLPGEGMLIMLNDEAVIFLVNHIDRHGRVSFCIKATKRVKFKRIKEVK